MEEECAMSARGTAVVGGIGLVVAAAGHFGAFGDDVARLLGRAPAVVDVFQTASEGASVLRGLSNGDGVERAVAEAACLVATQQMDDDPTFEPGQDYWAQRVEASVPPWVWEEPSGEVQDTIESAANALTLLDTNARVAQLYVQHCVL